MVAYSSNGYDWQTVQFANVPKLGPTAKTRRPHRRTCPSASKLKYVKWCGTLCCRSRSLMPTFEPQAGLI